MIRVTFEGSLSGIWIDEDCEHELTGEEYAELLTEDIGALLEEPHSKWRIHRDGELIWSGHWYDMFKEEKE